MQPHVSQFFNFLFCVWIVVGLILRLRRRRVSGEILLAVSLIPAGMALLLFDAVVSSSAEYFVFSLLILSALFFVIWGIIRMRQQAVADNPALAHSPIPVLTALKKHLSLRRRGRRDASIMLLESLFLFFWALFLWEKVHKPGHPFAKLIFPLVFSAALALLIGAIFRFFGWSLRVAPPTACPSIGRLKDFLSDGLPSDERIGLAAHLELCPTCQHRIEGLTAGQKSWPGMARKLSEPPPSPEPALRKVMNRLKENNEEKTSDEPVFCSDLPLGFLSPSEKPGQLGRLERYEVLQEIGRGGMGVVLKAFDPSLHRVVAIKVLAPQLATSGVARKRFLREAKAAAAVNHDHIVTIHAVDEANGLPYLVMQYVAGQSLQQRIDKDGPLELADILRIGMQTASGLAAAHAQGIVHRDIKPANILLEEGVQRVKITDFGLARAMDDASLTQSGFVAGSPLFMAPEQARGEALDHRADLFSLGSVLYTMCTGRPPFRAANTLAVLRRVSEDPPRPIRETNPEIPDWLSDIVSKLMAKEPLERFQSAAEVEEELGRHLAQLQHPDWVPPPRSAAPAVAADLPTSVTLCPSCGTSLHVPERMVGSIVHCFECGKPFHVEEGSEVMQVARPAQWPLRPRFRLRRKLRGCLWIIAGFVALFLLILLSCLFYELASESGPATATIQPLGRWSQLDGLPPTATVFGAIEFKPPEAPLTLDDERTQSLFRLFASKEMANDVTSKNFGRIHINGVGLACYASPESEDTLTLIHLNGTALDGRRRIVNHVRQSKSGTFVIEGEKKVQLKSKSGMVVIGGEDKVQPMDPIHLRSNDPDNSFNLKIIDNHHAYLAAYRNPGNQAPELSQIERQVPSAENVLSGSNPPWVQAALRAIPADACGFFLGELPDLWGNRLMDILNVWPRVHPRSFVCHFKRASQGFTFNLTLNVVNKAQGNAMLRDDLDKWRGHALDSLRMKYPALAEEREALTSLGKILQSMHWTANNGSVQTQVHISGQDWKVLSAALERMSRINK